MDEPILIAKVERGDDGTLRVLAPRVGTWSEHPHAGALLGPGSRVGKLQHLNRRSVVILPDETAGRVSAGLPADRAIAVEYGQLLFDLSPVLGESTFVIEADAVAVGRTAGAGLAEGARAVVSPTDGVFYRSPSPGAPPFVEAGGQVRTGDPVGLVEVMKTFNQILYGGPGFPEQATVVEVRCGDAEEIRAGQVLVVVR